MYDCCVSGDSSIATEPPDHSTARFILACKTAGVRGRQGIELFHVPKAPKKEYERSCWTEGPLALTRGRCMDGPQPGDLGQRRHLTLLLARGIVSSLPSKNITVLQVFMKRSLSDDRSFLPGAHENSPHHEIIREVFGLGTRPLFKALWCPFAVTFLFPRPKRAPPKRAAVSPTPRLSLRQEPASFLLGRSNEATFQTP